MATLADLELDEQTIVLFTSDNGGFAKATSNKPLRANKGSNYEGGIRVPLLIKAPGIARPGVVSDEPVIGTDLYPTILEASGMPSRPHQHLDGLSPVPLLDGKNGLDRDAIYWHYPHYNQHPESFPSGVVRSDKWKLIQDYESGKTFLFDLDADIGEQHDLAEECPDVEAEMREKLIKWRRDVGADPMRPNPMFQAQ